MSDDFALRVTDLSKVYRIWRSPGARLTTPLLQGIANALPKPIGDKLTRRAAAGYRDFNALKGISLEVRRGESVGIIGRNGSGKSTLLQIIAGTLQPTSGTVEVRGRVAALLELGSGFNPEFTGRENVYLNAAVLGLTRAQTDERFDRIAAFADIGDFLDQPVKTYSSGMQLRLAFAVQTAVEPDVLIVDEALSVGDEAFQRKCFARIESLRARGTTLLLVSHDIQTVSRICPRAVLLHAGEALVAGPSGLTGKLYQKLLYTPGVSAADIRCEFAQLSAPAPAGEGPSPTGDPTEGERGFLDASLVSQSLVEYAPQGARIESPRVTNRAGRPVNHLEIGRDYQFSYEVSFDQPAERVVFACAIKTKEGLELAGMHSHAFPEGLESVAAGTRLRVRFDFRCDLNPGLFFFNAGVLSWTADGFTYRHRLVDAVPFRAFIDQPVRTTAICRLVQDCTITSA